MAEALAAVGAAASIVQLLDLGSKVVRRLNEFHSKSDEVPKCFQHIETQLPLLLDTLSGTQKDIGAGMIGHDTEKALLPVVNACRQQIESLDDIVEKLLPKSSESWIKKNTKVFSSLIKESKVESITAAVSSYVQTLTFYHAAARSTLNPLRDDKLIKIRQWLSAPDPSTNYQKGLKLRQANTGLWLLQSEQYLKWKEEPSSIIWLNGIPGCGKTILSSTVIEDILDRCAHDPGKAAAYFYFDFKDAQKQSPELMLKSLVTQISQQCIRMPPLLESLYGASNNGQWQPSEQGLLDTLRNMSAEFPATYIILDALDECAQREELMSVVETIAGWKLASLHIMVTSRKERDIESSLLSLVEKQNIVPLQSKVVDEDIRKYVHHRLSVDKKLQKWRGGEMQTKIEVALMNGAHGMFRWAVCQLDTLGNCNTKAMLRKSLKRLPPTLDETYERILCAIHEDHSIQALRILQWLAFSLRPLHLDELAEVIAIDPNRSPAFDKDEVLEDPWDAMHICASLITVSSDGSDEANYDSNTKIFWKEYDDEKPKTTIALAHYSVKEYLTSTRIWEGPARTYGLKESTCHQVIANSCIGYLLQFSDAESFCEETMKTHVLARYSAKYWTGHARFKASKSDSQAGLTHALTVRLLFDRNGACLNWTRIHNIEEPWRGRAIDMTRQVADVAPPLYYASRAGLANIADYLVHAEGADVNAQGGRYGNALQAAAEEGGNQEVVELLLEAGADVNAQGGYYGNALQAAAAATAYGGKQEVVVKLLLEAGADVNAQGGKYGNALQAAAAAAAYRGKQEVVELLLDAGATRQA